MGKAEKGREKGWTYDRYQAGIYLISDVNDPVQQHGTRLRATLATDDDPVDALEVHLAQVFNQWLVGEELNAGIELAEMVHAHLGITTLDGDPQPHVVRN